MRKRNNTISNAMPTVEYPVVPLSEIKIEATVGATGRRGIKSMKIQGREVGYTSRFGVSLAAQCGFAPSIFKFFDHEEVFGRIIERGIGDRYRCALSTEGDKVTALAVSRPNRQIIRADDLANSLRGMGIDPSTIQYANGVVTTQHTPSVVGKRAIKIAGDEMISRFVAETPIDGYGGPSTFLMMIRTVCSNGAIGYAPAFRSQVNLGAKGKGDESALPTWERFMSTYNNEEGFAAMRERFEVAAKSWASLDEFNNLYKLFDSRELSNLHQGGRNPEDDEEVPGLINGGRRVANYNSDINKKLREVAGDVTKMYGVVSLDSMSAKQRRKIPTGASMYDLINLATEISTHRADITQSRRIQAWVGTTLQGEYDLEGTRTDNEQAQDLFLHDRKAVEGLAN